MNEGNLRGSEGGKKSDEGGKKKSGNTLLLKFGKSEEIKREFPRRITSRWKTGGRETLDHTSEEGSKVFSCTL